MIAILLCAGFATRLYPLTKTFPKPLLDVAGRPAIDYLIDQIITFPRLETIHVVTNAVFFENFVEWGEKWKEDFKAHGITLYLHNDGSTSNNNRLGAVSDLAFVLNSTEVNTGALVAAGDNIVRFPLRPIWDKFLDDDKNYVLGLPVEDIERAKRTGVLELGRDDRVLRFHEKPQDPPSSLTCPAIYFLKPSALRRVDDYISLPNTQDAPGHFISFLVTREPVYAVKIKGQSIDIGTIESYDEANNLLARERVIIPPSGQVDDG